MQDNCHAGLAAMCMTDVTSLGYGLLLFPVQAIAQQQHKKLLCSAKLDGEQWRNVAARVYRQHTACSSSSVGRMVQ